MAVVAADKDSLTDDDWRAIDLGTRRKLPHELAGRAVDRVDVFALATNDDELVGHCRGRHKRQVSLLGRVTPDDVARLPIHGEQRMAGTARPHISDVANDRRGCDEVVS